MTDAPNDAVKIGVVLDCGDAERQAAFWAAALGYHNLGAAGNYVVLLPPEEAAGLPRLLMQQVAEPKVGKNRMHIDLDDVPDVEAEVARLEGLGAVRVDDEPLREHGMHWVRMTDPEGNEFCVCGC